MGTERDRGTDDSDARPDRRLREWVLLYGPRSLVAAIATLAIFAFLTAVSLSRFSPFRDPQPVYYAFGG